MLHYTPDVTLASSVVHLILARDGAISWHNAINGGGKKDKDGPMTPEKRKNVADGLRAFAHAHNQKFAAKKAQKG